MSSPAPGQPSSLHPCQHCQPHTQEPAAQPPAADPGNHFLAYYYKFLNFKVPLALCTTHGLTNHSRYLPALQGQNAAFPSHPSHFLLFIKLSFILKQSIFPEQKAEMLHFDKVKTKPLLCQKYSFHVLFCPTSHHSKSELTNIVTHPRTILFGKQTICQKAILLLLPVRHVHRGGSRNHSQPLAHLEPISACSPRQGKLLTALPTSQHHLLLLKAVIYPTAL